MIRSSHLHTRRPVARAVVAGLLCLWAVAPAAAAAAEADHAMSRQRQAAVVEARAGHVDDARQRLEALFAAHPQARRLRLDLAVVAQWGGDDARTTALLDTMEPASLPDYVLEAYAKAARNLKRWDRALALYGQLHRRQPRAVEFQLATALVLADAGRVRDARRLLASLRAGLAPDAHERADVYVACGYVEERERHLIEALGWYQRALAVNPDHAEAQRRRILTASSLGASAQALAVARAQPGLLSAADMQRLELDAAARELRLASLPGPAARDHAGTALAADDALLTAPGLDTARSPHGLSLRFDRIAALTADGRAREAVDAFEALEPATPPAATAAGRDDGALGRFPVYVLAAAADAYMAIHRPDRAAALYQAALGQAPHRFDLERGLYYAWSDLEAYGKASALAAHMIAEQPAWTHPQPAGWRANPRYAESHEIAALDLAFRDRYTEALASFSKLLDLAPANTDLRLSRAQVLRWRGWLAEAERDVGRVRASEPDNLRAHLLDGELDLDSRRYQSAEQVLTDAARRAPDAPDTLALATRWRLHNRPEVSIEAGAGRSDGAAFASRHWETDSHYFTAPAAYRYRVFVHDLARYGRFQEGPGRDHRLGAGLEYRGSGWRGRAEVNAGLADGSGPGAALQADWFTGDRLTLDAAAAVNSTDVPLRGTRAGVRGNELTLGARYRWDEAREAAVSTGILAMNDDNRRRWLQLDGSRRVMNLPRHKLLATLRMYASHNTETDRAYYNPLSDRELVAGLVHEWRLTRTYDHGLTQRAGIEGGTYWQQGFGSGPVWSAFIEHDWQLGSRAGLRYGVRTGAHRYDGDREHETSVFVALEWRP